MITLAKYNPKSSLPESDYVLETSDKFFDIVNLLTPKFNGSWEFVLIDPKLKFVKDLISNKTLPDWINVILLLSNKKIEEVVLQYPEYQPKDKSRKEQLNDIIAELTHVIDNSAKKALLTALGHNMEELRTTLLKLDKECTGEKITLKQVQGEINYTKRVYASDVVNAFLLRDARRWNLYNTLVREIGAEISYYAMYKYVKSLLTEKENYLLNKDIKKFIVKRIDAPLVCYAYTLFANSTNHYQLYGILYCLENRSNKSLERLQKVNI